MKNESKRPNEEEKRYGPFSKCMKVKPGMSGFKKRHDKVHASSRWRNSEVEKAYRPSSREEIDEIKELAIMHLLSKENVTKRNCQRTNISSYSQRKESLTLCDMESFVTLQ
jgi:hypothetical protein